MLLALIATIPPAGVPLFAAYEAAVLPLLERHQGTLERRLRNVAPDGGWREIHLIRFATPEAFVAYRADPARAEHAHLLEQSSATFELMTMEEVA